MLLSQSDQIVERYEIVSLVGQGTYSEVYLARDIALKRNVALKALRQNRFPDQDDDENKLREAQILAKLNHPNIVTVFDTFQSEDTIFIAMEYLNGGTFTSLTPKISYEKLSNLFQQVAVAIAYAHDQGFIHGDIKPSNIAITADGTPKVIDFGLARLTGQASVLDTLSCGGESGSQLMGTLPFMAPELIRGEEAGILSDIFALGAVFYQLVYGKPPFSGSNEAAILNAVLSGKLPALKAHDEKAKKTIVPLLKRMLAHDKALRPATMLTVAQELRVSSVFTKAASFTHSSINLPQKAFAMPFWKTSFAVALIISLAFGYIYGSYDYDKSPSTSLMVMLETGFKHLKQYGHKGELTAAQAAFESVLLTDPENAAATAGLAMTLLRRYTAENRDPALYNRAKETAQLALHLDKNLALSHLAMGRVLRRKARYVEAKSFLDQALVLEPNNEEVQVALAWVEYRMGSTEQAIERLQVLSSESPDKIEFVRPLASFYFATGQHAKAERAFEKQIELSPDDARAYSNLSAVQHMQGDTLQAIATLQDGLKIRPSRVLYSNLGTYLFFRKQYPQAVKAFEDALHIQGGTHDFRIWANLADAYYMTTGKEELAQQAYRHALQLLEKQYPDWQENSTLSSKVGVYQAKMGDFLSAEVNIDRLSAENNAAPDISFRAAIIKELVGKRSDALQLLEQAINAGHPNIEIENAPELSSLRQSPEFHLLQTKLSSKTTREY